jgi:sugar/nucleoside kinase (ribokinase family)
MTVLHLRPDAKKGFRQTVGIGGIGAGIVFALEGEQTLGRNESRLGKLLDARDYCKLHIVLHYIATLMGAGLHNMSFRAIPAGVVGNDAAGQQLVKEMADAGMETQHVRVDPERKTLFSVCFVYPDGAGGNLTTSNSAAAALNEGDLRNVAQDIRAAGKQGLALCLPEVPLEIRRDFLRQATDCGNYRAASFVRAEIGAARAMNLFAMTDLVALNREEASALVGYPFAADRAERFLSDCSMALSSLQPHIRIVLTAGEDGAYGFENGMWEFCPAASVRGVSTAGAGDALLAGVLSGLAAGAPFIGPCPRRKMFAGVSLESALDLGLLLGSFSVTSQHTIHPDACLENLVAFAKYAGATISEELRSLFSEFEAMPLSVKASSHRD